MNLAIEPNGSKPGKAMHTNSTESYREQKKNGKTDHFRKRIWETLRDSNKPMTDREIMAELNEADCNNVRPEVTRLKQDGLIRECEKKICQWTGKKVRQTVICSTAYHTRPSGKYS